MHLQLLRVKGEKSCSEYLTVESGDREKKLDEILIMGMKYLRHSSTELWSFGNAVFLHQPVYPSLNWEDSWRAVRRLSSGQPCLFIYMSTFHSLQDASHERHSALSCRRWRRSSFALMCCVIIVWQPEAYGWILCRKQVLDAGYIEVHKHAIIRTHMHPTLPTNRDVQYTTLPNNYTPTTADKSSFCHPITHLHTCRPSTHFPMTHTPSSTSSHPVRIRVDDRLNTWKYLLFLILQHVLVFVCQVEGKHVSLYDQGHIMPSIIPDCNWGFPLDLKLVLHWYSVGNIQ